MNGKKVTNDIMTKVWTLHQKGIDYVTIAAVIETSPSSVKRIITIMHIRRTANSKR